MCIELEIPTKTPSNKKNTVETIELEPVEENLVTVSTK